MYRIRLREGIEHIIQLRNVAKVSLDKNILTITFTNAQTFGSQLFGCGNLYSKQYEETFMFSNITDARREFESVAKSMHTQQKYLE